MKELVIIRGLPGSGKSTLAAKEYPTYLHYELDHYFCDTKENYRFDCRLRNDVEKLIFKMVDLALSRGENVVVSELFLTLDEVDQYQSLAKYHGVQFSVITARGDWKNVHGVPFHEQQMMKAAFEEME